MNERDDLIEQLRYDPWPADDGARAKAADAIASLQARVESQAGYVTAFYELAEMLGIPSQPRSPQEVWAREMKPRLAAALAKQDDRA